MNLKKIIEKKKKYLSLFICVILAFVIVYISNNVTTMNVDLFGNVVKVGKNTILKENDMYYLSYEYVKENIDDEIFFDGVSKKVVISTSNGLYKIKTGDNNINVNFENKELANIGVIEKENRYISLEVLRNAYNIDAAVCNNTMYLYSNSDHEGKAKYNKVNMYKKPDLRSEIVDYVDKDDEIKVIQEKDNLLLVKVDKKVGYVSKNVVKYKIKKQEVQASGEQENKKQVYFFADSNNKSINSNMPIDGIILDMFDVTQTSTNLIESDIKDSLLNSVRESKYNIYGMISNGYHLAGFNTNTTSQILSDEAKRINLINNLNVKIKEYKLDGIVLDFRKLKERDVENYIQFVKELKAFSGIQVIVNIDSSEYKTYIPVINYTDFSIVNTYGQRDLKSTVAGSVSEIKWMNDIINNCLDKANNKKVVIGIPAYTILWTEKNSSIVGSEIYNLKSADDYINKNKLETKEVSGQNYAQLEKGILKYRIWLEDEFSIRKRLEIIEESRSSGIAIYKYGYEDENLLSELKKYKDT